MLFQTDVSSCNPTIDPATNKLIGYTFDNSGNTKVDATGQTFTYDAENKQILVKDANGNTIGEYFYDGDGKRVKKIANSEETIFVYNASGQLIADYATQISQTPKVSYLTSDHLGSPRITTDKDGDIYTRRDFMPFGEEIDIDDTPERKTELNYASDEIRQKFTSYERDEETELDFAQARMHNYSLGRFTSPDNFQNDTHTETPSSWNLYLYVRNNPLALIDPSGEVSTHIDKNGKIITVIKDGDTGVYQHGNNADGGKPTESMIKKRQKSYGNVSANGEYVGETEYVDEFISPENGKPMTEYKIQVGKQFDNIIQRKAKDADKMDLIQIAQNSKPGKQFDLKNKYKNVGALLKGKYVTSRSAGNYLAGYNAAGGTYLKVGISFKTFQKLAGALHVQSEKGKPLTKPQMVDIVIRGKSYGSAPTYGENNYQYRRSREGWLDR